MKINTVQGNSPLWIQIKFHNSSCDPSFTKMKMVIFHYYKTAQTNDFTALLVAEFVKLPQTGSTQSENICNRLQASSQELAKPAI